MDGSSISYLVEAALLSVLTFSFLKFADLLSGAEVFISVGLFDGGRRAGGGGGGER